MTGSMADQLDIWGKMDTQYLKMANLLVEFSTNVQPNELVIIECFDVPTKMSVALIEAVHRRNGHPILWQKSWASLRALLTQATKREVAIVADVELAQLKAADVYIGLRAALAGNELAGVPREGVVLFQTEWLNKVHYAYRVHNTRWCSAKWPTASAASAAGMSLHEFEDFYFRACLEFDYARMSKAVMPLANLMERTERVKILAPGTDIEFSIKNIPVVKCVGDKNLPDGEVFTAPIKDSVNGNITYNVSTSYQGMHFDGIQFEVSNGRIVNAACSTGDPQVLRSILQTDEGASYFGEFAVGVNQEIARPVGDTMFDEKMAGSIHLTPGNSYAAAFNGNRSSIHWDIVLDLKPASGGGIVLFDDEVVIRDGQFVGPDLQALNSTNYSNN